MATIRDEKPRIILNEYSISKNVPTAPTIFDEIFDIKTLIKKFRIVIVRYEENELEFDLVGIHPFLANCFRRILLSDVPSMAIEKVLIYNNTSIIQDEVLSHRLGLIPLKADPRKFDYRPDDNTEGSEQNTLEFELKIKCNWQKNKEERDVDLTIPNDVYVNNNVYSKNIKWLPIGDQASLFTEEEVGPIHDDILIAKMRPGHELDLKLIAVKGIGRDHAKFSPVATASYRLLPDIRITREVVGEQAECLQQCFSPGVIGLKNTKDNRKVAYVKDSRYDASSRNVFRYDDLKDAVVMSKIRDHFIFSIESVGAVSPDILFLEAIKVLRNKCAVLLDEVNNIM